MKKFKRIKPRKFKRIKPRKPTSDNAVVAQAIISWAVLIIAVIVVAGFGICLAYRKTSSAISSYQENSEVRAAQKEIRVRERVVATEKRAIAPKKAEKKKAVAAGKRKARRGKPTFEEYREANKPDYTFLDGEPYPPAMIATLKQTEKAGLLEDWQNEYGDLMFHADGRLRDPCPEDNYTAEQGYWILALFLFAVFVVFAGCLTGGNLIAVFIACIIALIGSIIVWSW